MIMLAVWSGQIFFSLTNVSTQGIFIPLFANIYDLESRWPVIQKEEKEQNTMEELKDKSVLHISSFLDLGISYVICL